MSTAISVRLDPEALQAVARLEATGLSRSEAIRRAILDSAARLQRRAALAAEVAALEADEDDPRGVIQASYLQEQPRTVGAHTRVPSSRPRCSRAARSWIRMPPSGTRQT